MFEVLVGFVLGAIFASFIWIVEDIKYENTRKSKGTATASTRASDAKADIDWED